MSSPSEWTLRQAADAIRSRQITSVELTLAALKRIESWQPVTNAFIAIEADRALAVAQAADATLAAGGPIGSLHGVPLAHKDMYYRAGRVTTCGSKVQGDFVPAQTATVLARLDAAGAVDLGRLNMSEFALGPTGINAHFGRARNPWNPDVVTGGSSSGSGAAVAAGMVYGALGSDTGGSIRLPSVLCGISGLKPTQGRVSRFGVMPLSFSQDCVGPMAPTVADVATLYEAIAGHDPLDPTSSQRPVMSVAPLDSLKSCKIGFCEAWEQDLDIDVAAALTHARSTLGGLGATLQAVTLPDPLELGELSNIVAMTEAAAIHTDWLRERAEDYGPQIRARLRQGMVIPGALYLRALQMRASLLDRVIATAFAQCDALILPVAPYPAPRAIDVDGPLAGGQAGAGIPQLVASMAKFTRPISYLGLPALTVCAAVSRHGLPVGFQIVGRPFDEAGILSIGMAFEQAIDRKRLLPDLPTAASTS